MCLDDMPAGDSAVTGIQEHDWRRWDLCLLSGRTGVLEGLVVRQVQVQAEQNRIVRFRIERHRRRGCLFEREVIPGVERRHRSGQTTYESYVGGGTITNKEQQSGRFPIAQDDHEGTRRTQTRVRQIRGCQFDIPSGVSLRIDRKDKVCLLDIRVKRAYWCVDTVVFGVRQPRSGDSSLSFCRRRMWKYALDCRRVCGAERHEVAAL